MKKITLITLFLLLIFFDAFTYAHNIQKEIADNVIRLHVIANSDDPADQELKLKVRNAILAFMREKDYQNREIAYTSIQSTLPEIEKIAQDTIIQNGYQYSVKAELGEFDFPQKDYNNLSFPSGKYTALRITIGQAVGHNWWCVMYPTLCFSDATIANETSVNTTQAEENLKASLSKESFAIISNHCELKFKIVDLFQSIFSN